MSSVSIHTKYNHGRLNNSVAHGYQALLGEMDCEGASVTIRGRVAYAAQSAFILNATLRDNVTFGREFEQEFYNQVIEACALDRDLENMKRGDLSEIGEGGATISGGQKQRVSLARTVYAGTDTVILDDILSAVDGE